MLAREPAHVEQQTPLGDALIEVELEEPGGDFTFWGKRFDHKTSQHKMRSPSLAARMEQVRHFPVLSVRFNQFREDFLTQRTQRLAQRNAKADFLCGLCSPRGIARSQALVSRNVAILRGENLCVLCV